MTASDPDIPAAKALLRAHAVAVRRAAEERLGAAAAGNLLAGHAEALAVPPGSVVAGYWPMGDEIDPRPLMRRLAESGCRLVLPVVAAPGQALDFLAWRDGDPLVPGPFGTRHPVAAAAPLIPTVLLVPLLAFDRCGYRLGYGGGYYDRTLDSLGGRSQLRSIGLAYAAQEVALVPHDRHDQRLDAVATEIGVIDLETR
jgi:5-formyltetrahydrofolate cyclo-ligase